MKMELATTKAPQDFQPIKIVVTIERQDEADAIQYMAANVDGEELADAFYDYVERSTGDCDQHDEMTNCFHYLEAYCRQMRSLISD